MLLEIVEEIFDIEGGIPRYNHDLEREYPEDLGAQKKDQGGRRTINCNARV